MKTRTRKPAAAARRQKASVPSTTRAVLPARKSPAAAAMVISPKWKWHYGTLLALRDRLRIQRGEQLGAASEPLERHSMDMADSATDEFDHDLALGQLSADQDALFEVEDALKRIANGTYGVCGETGKKIPAARLKAIPWARFCVEVEARLEMERSVGRRRLGQLGSVQGDTGQLEDAESEETQTAPADEALSARASVPIAPFHTKNTSAAPHRPQRRKRGNA